MANTVLPLAPFLFTQTLTVAQKLRFWKAVALLVAACVVYIMYLNIAGFQSRVSSQHRQQKSPPHADADASRHEQSSSESSQNSHQKVENEADPSQKQQTKRQTVQSPASPQKLKAVILKSIPHDTSAFTQVSKVLTKVTIPLSTEFFAGFVL